MAFQVDLNCDLGEGFGPYVTSQDEEILNWVTSCNVACGFHAGDYQVMRKTVRWAKEKGVALGAHPGLPDLMGFGRRQMEINPDEVCNLVLYQLGALDAFAKSEGVFITHVKPHGALYHMAANQEVYANAIVEAIVLFNPALLVYGLAGSKLIHVGREKGVAAVQEVFSDRTYQPDGSLTPRGQSGAIRVDCEESIAQVVRMVKEGVIETTAGNGISVRADTVCIHGDHPGALSYVKKLHKKLREEGILISSIGS